MALLSPFFRTLPLAKYGLEWIHPGLPLAHPLDDSSAVILERSLKGTAVHLDADRDRYIELMAPTIANWARLEPLLLAQQHIPRHPTAAAHFGLHAMRSASGLARSTFSSVEARGLFAGLAAHSILPLEQIPSAAFGLVLAAAAHIVGWPFARGGSQKLTNALASYLHSLGGEIITGSLIESLDQLPSARIVLCDMTPRQLVRITGSLFSSTFRRNLERFQYGPGVCKLDWALDRPIPWAAEPCTRAGTVHLGGTLEEIEAAERAPWHRRSSEKPFVLLAQPTIFDPSRAPAGKHIAWAYCHVPNGSSEDMTERIENQVERFAPGFRKGILKRNVIVASSLELRNPNLIGGDITGGASNLNQFFLRPSWRRYKTPVKRLYICSASTPPGGGVHGMCGHLAARRALLDTF
jgi:phytoene dehydrogenase-like protein